MKAKESMLTSAKNSATQYKVHEAKRLLNETHRLPLSPHLSI